MSLTIHDFRVSLRDKTRLCTELEGKITEVRAELINKEASLIEKNDLIRKKDEIIAIKELIIKEKDNQIAKLQTELLNRINDKNSTNNKSPVENGFKKSPNILMPLTNILPEISYETDKNSPEAKLVTTIFPKSKRVAISAEPSQNRFKSKESRVQLVEYRKNEK